MGLKKYLYNYIKENGELTYTKLEEICKGDNPMKKWFKVDTGRRALNDFKDIEGKLKDGGNYTEKWIWIGEEEGDLIFQDGVLVKIIEKDINKELREHREKKEIINPQTILL